MLLLCLISFQIAQVDSRAYLSMVPRHYIYINYVELHLNVLWLRSALSINIALKSVFIIFIRFDIQKNERSLKILQLSFSERIILLKVLIKISNGYTIFHSLRSLEMPAGRRNMIVIKSLSIY